MSTSILSMLGAGSSSSSSSGIDVTAVVEQILEVKRAPERLWQAQQDTLTQATSAWGTIQTNLSALSDKVFDLTNVLGPLSAQMATSSDPSVVIASAQNSAISGTHVLTVDHLATTSSSYTDPVTASTLSDGKVTIQVGSASAVEITVDSTNNTLSGLADAINNKNLGVTASVITDANGQRLALASRTSGAPGTLTVSTTVAELKFNTTTAKNASFTLDGVPISSASNTVSTVIPGVTLNLVGASYGDEVQLTVGPDTDAAKQAINDFVGAYNTLITSVNAQYVVDPTTATAGALADDGSLRLVQSALLSDMSYSMTGNNGIVGLASLGITTNNDGTLSVDDATLTSAIKTQFSDVQNFFQSYDSANRGFAANFDTDLNALLDPIAGPVALDLQGIDSSQKSLADQIQDLEDQLATQSVQLINQYSAINVALQQLPLIQQQIESELAGIPAAGA